MGGNRYRYNRGGNFHNTPDRSTASTPGRKQYGRSGIAHFSFAGYGFDPYEDTRSFKYAENLWKKPVTFISAGSIVPIENPKTLEEKRQIHLKELHAAVQEELEAERQHLSALTTAVSVSTPAPLLTPEPSQIPAASFPHSSTSRTPVFTPEIPIDPRPVSPSPSVSSIDEVIIFRGRKSTDDPEQLPKKPTTSPIVAVDTPIIAIPEVPISVTKSASSASKDKPATTAKLTTVDTEPKEPLDLDDISRAVQAIVAGDNTQDLDFESAPDIDASPDINASPDIDTSPDMVKSSQRRASRREARWEARKRKNQKKSGANKTHFTKALQFIDVYGDEDEDDSDLVIKDYMDNMMDNDNEFLPTSWSRRDLGGEDGDIFIGESTDDESANPTTKGGECERTDDKEDLLADEYLNVAQVTTQDVIPTSTENSNPSSPNVIVTPSGGTTENSNTADTIGIDAGLLDDYYDEEDDEESEGDDVISGDVAGLHDQLGDQEDDIDDDDFFSQDIVSVFPRQSFKKKRGKNSIFTLTSSQSLVPNLDEVLSHTCAGKKRKGKGSSPFFDQDLQPEFREIMMKSMKTNRVKKAEKKRQRELLRSQGILGRDQDDLSVKYPTGMTYQQITDEIWAFIADDNEEQLNLPSMTPDYRKGVHELAHKCNLISKSSGKGDNRRTSLYKKGYEIIHRHKFEKIADRIGKQHFRSSYKGGNSVRKSSDKSRGGITSGSQSTKYMEGEVVGGSLPHIGTENRGHELLKKMGWSRGTALGSTENKGILEPVMQKMKSSRAGLG